MTATLCVPSAAPHSAAHPHIDRRRATMAVQSCLLHYTPAQRSSLCVQIGT